MSNSKISALTSATTPLAGTEVLPIVQSSATVKVATNDLTVRNLRANATTGILQVTGPTAGTTRIATVPDANWTAARTDAAQSFSGVQGFTSTVAVGSSVGLNYQFQATTNVAVGAAGFSQTLILSNQSIQSVTLGVANTTLQLQPNGADVSIGAGNLIPSTAAKGINFTANTPAAGMTSQLLNWYEEGVVTVTLTATTSGTITLNGSYNTMRYVRIGRQVTVVGHLVVSSVSSPVGALLLNGMPFTSAVGDSYRGSVSILPGTLAATAITQIGGLVNSNSTILTLYKYSAGGLSNLSGDVQANSEFYITVTYFI